jgi:WD40 repeat protein
MSLQVIHGYYGHEKQISSIIFLKNFIHLASSSYDGTIRVWKISGNIVEDQEVSKYTGAYALLALTQLDSETLAFGGDDCVITVWNWMDNAVIKKYFAHLGSITSLSIC